MLFSLLELFHTLTKRVLGRARCKRCRDDGRGDEAFGLIPKGLESVGEQLTWNDVEKRLEAGVGDEGAAKTNLGAIKLIHTSELEDLDRFESYQDYNGTTYQEYRAGTERIERLRSSVKHLIGAEEATLSSASELERRILAEVVDSKFLHPVLFVSHRWESKEHPDPASRQLKKLRALNDCWLIYDYSSFPQAKRSVKDVVRRGKLLLQKVTPSGERGAPLFDLFGDNAEKLVEGVFQILYGREEGVGDQVVDEATLRAVKLIHASELDDLERFERYQDYNGTTYQEYRAGAARINRLRPSVKHLIDAEERLAEIDHDGMVEYDTVTFKVPSSCPPLKHELKLTRERLPGTKIDAESGTVQGDVVTVMRGQSEKTERVKYLCPSRICHEEEIKELKETLSSTSELERRILAEVVDSKFLHPVLFVSHRWESKEHPDREGNQLKKLRALNDCWLIYDYCSFPQAPRSVADDANLDQIFDHMSELIECVVVLYSPDYLQRGWCIYEYIVSSLNGSIVCDEIANSDFVALREWAQTNAPIAVDLFNDRTESQQHNFVNEQIIESVNRILPVFQEAKYTEPRDKEIVRALLVSELKSALPTKKVRDHTVSEWKHVAWTDEELESAFKSKLEWPNLASFPIAPYRMDVPMTVEEAVRRNYEIRRETVAEGLKTWVNKIRNLDPWQ